MKDKPFTQQKCSNNSTSHSFIHCSWDNSGLVSNGGAIHLCCDSSQPLISLTVDECTFQHCYETSSDGAGAVYAQNIGISIVENSFFYDCKCATNTLFPEGAGVLFNYIRTSPLIKLTFFLSCITGDDGGGCGIWYSNSSITYVVDSCRFIKCKGTTDNGCQGGGIIIAHCTTFIACTNCLLCACEAKHQGGGIWIMCPTGAPISPITFCFFHENQSDNGRDVYFQDFDSVLPAIAHSFSFESTSGRVGAQSDDWLPSGIVTCEGSSNGTTYLDDDVTL